MKLILESWRKYLNEADTDGDGSLDPEELRKMAADLERDEVRIPGRTINGRDVYYVKNKNDKRDAGRVALTRTSEPLSIEKQREHCRSRSRNERVHFNEKTKRCEYDYLNEEETNEIITT